jgi:hypothetical protein
MWCFYRESWKQGFINAIMVLSKIQGEKMKRQLWISLIGLLVVMGLMITGCKSDDGGGGIIDDPAAGSMTVETGRAIFEYDVDNDLGGVVIKKFISEEALKAYLTPSSRKAGDEKITVLILKTIDGYEIMKIDTKAFSPFVDEITGDILADISTIVEAINLPETITEIAADAFSGIVESLTVQVPEAVIEGIDNEVLQKIEGDIGTELEPYVPNPPTNNGDNKQDPGPIVPDPNMPNPPVGKDNSALIIGTWETGVEVRDFLTFTATECINYWQSMSGSDTTTMHFGSRRLYKYIDDAVYIYFSEDKEWIPMLWPQFSGTDTFTSNGDTFTRVN